MRNSSNFARLSGLLLIGVLMLLVSIQGVNVQAGAPAQATSAAGGAAATQGAGGTGGTGGNNAGTLRFPACTPAKMFGTGALATQGAGSTGTSGTAATPSTAGMAATQNAGGTAGTTNGNAYLGIRAAAVDSCGIQVAEVFANSPAAAAGLQVDDVIVAIDGQALPTVLMNSMNTNNGGTGTGGAVATSAAGGLSATQSAGGTGGTGGSSAGTITPGAMVTEFLPFMDRMHKPGDMITLTVQRNGSEMDFPVTLAALPGSAGAGGTGGTTGAGGAAATATTMP